LFLFPPSCFFDSIAGNFFPCKDSVLQQGFGILLDFSTWFMTVSFVRNPFVLRLFLSSFLKSYVAAIPSVTKAHQLGVCRSVLVSGLLDPVLPAFSLPTKATLLPAGGESIIQFPQAILCGSCQPVVA
jgi:hypothetical protein